MLGLKEFNKVFIEEAKKLYISMVNDNRLNKFDNHISGNEILNNNKILILGYSQVSNNIILNLCEEYGFSKDNIELITDKDKIKSFDCTKLKSKAYDLIVVGQLPHKMRKLRYTNNNVVKEIETNINNYKNVFVARNSNRIRITKESLETILINNMLTCIC